MTLLGIHFNLYGQYLGKGPIYSEIKMSNGEREFKEYISSFEQNYVNEGEENTVYFIFLYDEKNAHEGEKIEHLHDLIMNELNRPEDSDNRITRLLDFPSTWVIQQIPTKYIVQDFSREDAKDKDEKFYAGHLTVWIYSKNNDHLKTVVKRIKENKPQLNIHTVRDFSYVRSGIELKQHVVEKIVFGGSCMMDEDSLLLKQILNVFDFDELSKKKALQERTAQNRSSQNVKEEPQERMGNPSSSPNPSPNPNQLPPLGNFEMSYFRTISNVVDGSFFNLAVYNKKMQKGKVGGYLNFGRGNYQYGIYLSQWIRTNDVRKVMFNNIKEEGSIDFNQYGVGVDYDFKLIDYKTSDRLLFKDLEFKLGVSFSMGVLKLRSANYIWLEGYKNTRGYYPGIDDELVNIPELGFQDGVSVKGQTGVISVGRTPWYWQISPRIELVKRNIFISCGASYFQNYFQSTQSNLLLGDQDEIGIGGVYQNIDIRNWLMQIGVGFKI